MLSRLNALPTVAAGWLLDHPRIAGALIIAMTLAVFRFEGA